MLDVELYKIIDPGHFWCKPYSRNKSQQDQYYTLISKISDYCSKVYEPLNKQLNQRSPKTPIPSKGKICLVKRTSDRCWYRAKILSVLQTINGPQARVLLVDLGERTLVPGLWVQEIPEDFISTPFQTMECVLSDLKPITLVMSYFDLTTTKQPGDTWDIASSEWFRKQVKDATIQVDVKHIDDDGVHHVFLFANGPEGNMVCLNDELINKDFAVLSKTEASMKRDQNRFSSLNKERTQDLFLKDHKEIIEQLNSPFSAESDSSDSHKYAPFVKGMGHKETHSIAPTESKYPPITGVTVVGNDAWHARNGTEFSDPMINRRRSGLSSDEECGKVRFLSARLPATGSGSNISPGTSTKQLKPILKTSSGYSSGEHENLPWNVPNEARLTSRHSISAHERNVSEYAPITDQRRPMFQSDVQERDIAQAERDKQNTTFPSSHADSSLPSQNVSRSPVYPSSSPIRPTRIPLNPDRLPNVNPSLSPNVHTPSPSLSSHIPASPSRSPHVASSQSPRIPTTSPSRSPYVASSSQSPRIPTTSPSRSPGRVPSSPLPSSNLCHVSKDIFIHGEGRPRPITHMDSSIFPETVLRMLREMEVTQLSSFQSNVCPAIIRGRDVCEIGKRNSGNPLTYLLPIVTRIAEPGFYSDLPMGNGPLALILCSGWRKAAAVYEYCCKLTKKIRNIRVQVVFGAGAEDENILHLINGCEIIIATAPCLVRMLKKGYTRLDRLCHLVFDDADVLVEERTECIKELMREYGGLLSSQPNRLAPRQCIAMASKWTPGVCSLVKAYLGNPLIFISNAVETAMFCNVRQTVNCISISKRGSQLIGLLDSLMTTGDHEIIIFTSAAKDAERLSELLHHCSYNVLVAHEFMQPEHLNEVHRQWNTPHSSESFQVLVMTDGVSDKCNIRNSSCVIHYDFPATETSFGRRLFCMAALFPSTKERECLSVIFCTELTKEYSKSIKKIVTRAGGEIPSVLEEVTKMTMEEKEKRNINLDLCYFLKEFGVCKNSLTSCKERHTVFPDADVSELLPRSGIVKVLVLKVLDAIRYYVRILEHQNSSKKDDNDNVNYYSGATFLKLALDLNSWYSTSKNRRLCVVKLHKLCVVENEGSYHRVKMLRVVLEDPETNRDLEVEVYFVDRGDYEYISTLSLLEIDPQFVNIPFQAVEAIVCRVKPVDEDEWTKKSYRFIQQNIEGQELEGRVVMGLRNTIWLDPLVAKIYLADIHVTTNTFNVRMDLLKEGLAVPNSEHIKNLTRHLESFVTSRHLTGQENSERSLDCVPLLETATLSEDDYELVYVSAVENPGLLYVRLNATSDSLKNLLDQISDGVAERLSSRMDNEEELAIGSLCVARFTVDDKWYRGKIFSIRPEGEYDVFYVDYGDREWVTKDRIVPAWSDILQLPHQAIECSLVNISPIESEWTEEDEDVLWDMTSDKLLNAKVKSKNGAMFAGTFHYGIELYDCSSKPNVLINHELVLSGNGQATLECHKTLFPEAFEDSGETKEHFEEIPYICLQLYKTQDPNKKLQLAKEIKNIVSENLCEEEAIRESGGVRCICRLLGVTRMETVQEYLVITLAFLAAQNDQNCDEIRREGGLKALCYLLTTKKSVKVQQHTAWALKHLATNDRNRDTIREFGGVTNLCLLLDTTTNDKVQENICWAIVAACADDNKNCDTIREAGGLDRLFSLLKTSNNDCVLENVMWAISTLAGNAKNKIWIGEKGGIETICSLVKNNQNDKIFKNAVQSLKTLSNCNDNNREIMCRLGMIDVMRRFTCMPRGLQFDTRRICLDLTQRLLGRTSNIPLIDTSVIASLHEPITRKPIYVTRKKRIKENGRQGTGLEDTDDDDLPLLEDTAEAPAPPVHPVTKWSQTKRFVTLSIKLRGVESKVTNITEKSFYFRTKHLGKHYELNFEFFAGILPKECKVNLRGSEVLVNLKKAESSTWKRLLASPEKHPYLSIDFDRWDTDSSDEGDTSRSRVRVPMSKSSKATKLDYVMPREDESESDVTDEEDMREKFFDFT